METSDMLRALAALAQPTRLAIYRLVASAGDKGMRTLDISRELGTPANTASTHIMILATARLIESTRQGKNVIYKANRDVVRQVASELVTQ